MGRNYGQCWRRHRRWSGGSGHGILRSRRERVSMRRRRSEEGPARLREQRARQRATSSGLPDGTQRVDVQRHGRPLRPYKYLTCMRLSMVLVRTWREVGIPWTPPSRCSRHSCRGCVATVVLNQVRVPLVLTLR